MRRWIIAAGLAAALCQPLPGAGVYRRALIVGINGHGLNYADNDAKAFETFLISRFGGAFPKERVITLINAEATRDRIFRAITDIGNGIEKDAADHLGSRTVVYFFIAGHSEVNEKTGEAFFIPSGSDPALPSAAIPSSKFVESAAQIRANRIVYFLDTCHAAAALDKQLVSASQDPEHRHMGLFSSSPHQRSHEDPALKHGIFTYYLLDGLRGAADRPPFGDGNGFVTTGELSSYVGKRVPLRARPFGPQNPVTSALWAEGSLRLAAVRPDTMRGIYASEDIPLLLLEKVRELVTAGEQIWSVSLAPDDTWTVISSLQYWTTAPGFLDFVQESKKTMPQGTLLTRAALAGGDSYLAVFGTNGYAPRSVPQELIQQLKEVRSQGHTINDVLFDTAGNYLVIYGTTRAAWRGVPKRLAAKLQEVTQAGHSFRQVALGPNGSYLFLFGEPGGRFGWSSVDMRRELMDVLRSVKDSGAPIQSLAVHPLTKAWIVIAPPPGPG